MASLLGLGGIGEKIRSILDTVRGPVGKAVDAVISGALKLAKGVISKLRGKPSEDNRGPEQKQKALDSGIADSEKLLEQGLKKPEIEKQLPAIKKQYQMASLRLVVEKHEAGGETVHVEGEVNPKGKTRAVLIPGGGPNLFKATKISSESFSGDFADFPPNAWGGYDGFPATKHPANVKYNHPNGKVPRPVGTYLIGGRTLGSPNRREWIDRWTAERDRRKQEFMAKGMKRGAADKAAMDAIGQEQGIPFHDLTLVGWEEHHIKPTNWGGGNGEDNLIFIRDGEHVAFTTFFNSKKSEIGKDIP